MGTRLAIQRANDSTGGIDFQAEHPAVDFMLPATGFQQPVSFDRDGLLSDFGAIDHFLGMQAGILGCHRKQQAITGGIITINKLFVVFQITRQSQHLCIRVGLLSSLPTVTPRPARLAVWNPVWVRQWPCR